MQKGIPTVLVVFGATGDLMKKKIVPALYNLFLKHKLPNMFRMIGVSRRAMDTASFQQYVIELLKHTHSSEQLREIEKFIAHFQFERADFLKKEGYDALSTTMGYIDHEWKVCSNKLFYLAVPPEFYEPVFLHLAKSGLTKPCSPEEGWTRVLVEKPFGSNAKTAEKLDEILGSLFKEEQIYRIDHYLAKEMIQNILMFRFSNNVLESSWNNSQIEKIEIKTLESIDVTGRGVFYDSVGALRDVGQNHLLQMLALVTMDNPQVFESKQIHAKKEEIASALPTLSFSEVQQSSIRAQYEGYHNVEGVKKDSTKETYFRVQFSLQNSRWQGVPIVLESGKAFKKPKKEIIITFRNPSSLLCPVGEGGCKNKVIISLEPKEAISMTLWSKKPGLDLRIREQNMHFIYRPASQRQQYVEEYEKLLLDAIEGNQLLFATTKEIAGMWKFTDAIVSAWERNATPLLSYKKGIENMDRLISEQSFAEKKTVATKKEIGIVGLGKIGSNIAKRLLEKQWFVAGFNRSPEDTIALQKLRLHGVFDMSDFSKTLKKPRVIWLTVPAGKPVDEIIFGKSGLVSFLQKGDIIVDGGNSFYKDSITRGERLKKLGLHFVDVGFSGGPGGARNGGSLMVGGEKKIFDYLLPLLIDMAVPQGVQFFEGFGAGHFVKMVHNGIEYGMMQAIAEGFTVLKKAKFNLDLTKVAEIYNHGSVIESKLVGWLYNGYLSYGQDLETISGSVAHLGEGMWTVNTAKEMKVLVPIIEQSLQFRIDSQKKPSYMGKVLSTLRNQFGGHAAK